MCSPVRRRVAVMQPYLFPYLGYFQLLHCADQFVLLDDVAYINRGWINRNRLLVAGRPWRFTLPLAGSSQNQLIRDVRLHPDPRGRRKLLATIRQAYGAAPQFEPVFGLVQQVLLSLEADLTRLVQTSLELLNAYVGLPVPLLRSSALPRQEPATGQHRIIALCEQLAATHYVNMAAGAPLYDPAEFARHGIGVQLLPPALPAYPQGPAPFQAGLSIIDVLMHNPVAQARALMQQAVLQPLAPSPAPLC